MRNKFIVLISLVVLVFNTGVLFSSQEKDQVVIKRFILAVGANSGGKDRAQLRYAVSDAEAILQVFQDLGGVADEDTLFLEEPDVRSFYTEMGKFQTAFSISSMYPFDLAIFQTCLDVHTYSFLTNWIPLEISEISLISSMLQ